MIGVLRNRQAPSFINVAISNRRALVELRLDAPMKGPLLAEKPSVLPRPLKYDRDAAIDCGCEDRLARTALDAAIRRKPLIDEAGKRSACQPVMQHGKKINLVLLKRFPVLLEVATILDDRDARDGTLQQFSGGRLDGHGHRLGTTRSPAHP